MHYRFFEKLKCTFVYFLVDGEKDVKEERGNINDAKVKILLKRNFLGRIDV